MPVSGTTGSVQPVLATTVAIVTHNRIARLLRTLGHLGSLPEVSDIVVADNGSSDGTADRVRREFPSVRVLRLRENFGAFGRTLAAQAVGTPLIAFCDDDTWWMPGAISLGAQIFARFSRIGALNARITIEPSLRLDPACAAMERAAPDGGPGRPILFFTAGAAMMRTRAFFECGGYERRLGIGAEETLLALDLQRRGWQLRYLPEMEVRHEPCPAGRDPERRRLLVDRNRLWVAWMRYRARSAWRLTTALAMRARSEEHARAVLMSAMAGLPWTLLHRAPVDRRLQRSIDAAVAAER